MAPVYPAPSVSSPESPPFAEACDTHTHIFGPFDHFPTPQKSTYAMPDAPANVHGQALKAMGVANGVLIQPGPYGTDPGAMLDAIASSGGHLKGVAAADPSMEEGELRAWADGGIVGLRFVDMRLPDGRPRPGVAGFDQLAELLPAMKANGMFAELWGTTSQIVDALPHLLDHEIPLVIEHMAMIDTRLPITNSNFTDLLTLLNNPLVWMKLVLCRVAGDSIERVRPFHEAIIDVAPDRCLWGSDWPYVNLDPAPDAASMLDVLERWVANEGVRHQILVDNPHRLFGFAKC